MWHRQAAEHRWRTSPICPVCSTRNILFSSFQQQRYVLQKQKAQLLNSFLSDFSCLFPPAQWSCSWAWSAPAPAPRRRRSTPPDPEQPRRRSLNRRWPSPPSPRPWWWRGSFWPTGRLGSWVSCPFAPWCSGLPSCWCWLVIQTWCVLSRRKS